MEKMCVRESGGKKQAQIELAEKILSFTKGEWNEFIMGASQLLNQQAGSMRQQ